MHARRAGAATLSCNRLPREIRFKHSCDNAGDTAGIRSARAAASRFAEGVGVVVVVARGQLGATNPPVSEASDWQRVCSSRAVSAVSVVVVVATAAFVWARRCPRSANLERYNCSKPRLRDRVSDVKILQTHLYTRHTFINAHVHAYANPHITHADEHRSHRPRCNPSTERRMSAP